MSTFKTTSPAGITFQRSPRVARNTHGKGWVIEAFSNDPSYYNGSYMRAVGFADEVPTGHVAFRLKRDAVVAMKDAINLGILKGE